LLKILPQRPWELEPGFSLSSDAFARAALARDINNAEIQEQYPHRRLDLLLVDGAYLDQYKDQHKKVLVTNNHVRAGELDPQYYAEFPSSWYGMYAGDIPIEPTTPLKPFNCFIGRMGPFRQSWAYQLVRRGLFDQGYISFRMDISNLTYIDKTATPHEVFEKNFQDFMPFFVEEHKYLKPIVPYCNFSNDDLNQAIMDSVFGIVLESCFENHVISFSEKIMRHLKLPRPWLLSTSQYGVRHLRQIGFDVLDDIVDHKYDNIEDNVQRQSCILDTAQNMLNLQIDTKLQQRLEQAANHNQQRLKQLYLTFDQDIEQTFLEAKTKCLALKSN
jgi:hypothetical protein